mmetsp:Transcript_45591/g.119753  ORF Transcript_45591/g.119753 Transcript_45591/m.119753 type:complete len:254 (-) Transcript_45591:38-799(-)
MLRSLWLVGTIACAAASFLPVASPSTRRRAGHFSPTTSRCAPIMSLRTVEDNAALEALIGQTANSNAVVVIHFDDPAGGIAETSSWDTPSWETSLSSSQESFSSALVSRVAETYATSSLYGGAPLICLQIDRDTGGVICSTRGIVDFPKTQIWARGTCTEVSSFDLEQKLLSFGVASAAKPFKKGPSSNRIGREVDDIDFTGGAGGRAFGERPDRGTTGRFSNFGDGSNAKRAKKPGDFGYKAGDNKEWLDNL